MRPSVLFYALATHWLSRQLAYEQGCLHRLHLRLRADEEKYVTGA